MSRIAKADVNRALQLAAATIVEAGGSDGRTSRADLKAKLTGLPREQQKLVDIFFKFIDARDFKAGAQVTPKDVKRAVEYAKEHMVAKYDLNSNGLSASEIAKMSLTGKRAVELSRALKAAAAPATDGVPVKFTAKLEYVYTNECDNQSTLQAKVKLPSGKTVNVELRNPEWSNWAALEKAGDKTFTVEGRVKLNAELRDIAALQQSTTPAEQAEGQKAWDDMYKDTGHWIETNMTQGILIVDSMKLVP